MERSADGPDGRGDNVVVVASTSVTLAVDEVDVDAEPASSLPAHPVAISAAQIHTCFATSTILSPSLWRRRVLANQTVDRFAHEIDVTHMARVLVVEIHHDAAQVRRPTAITLER